MTRSRWLEARGTRRCREARRLSKGVDCNRRIRHEELMQPAVVGKPLIDFDRCVEKLPHKLDVLLRHDLRTVSPGRLGGQPFIGVLPRDIAHAVARGRSAAFHGGCRAKAPRVVARGFRGTAGELVDPGPQAPAGAKPLRWSFSRLWVAAMRRHSERTAARPLRLKRPARRFCLMSAKTGSTITWRRE
jgi:hypothetical protein